MDAPLYLPSSAYEAPQLLPQPLSTQTSAIADLQADPEAVEILKLLVPSMAQARSGPVAILIEPLSLQDAAAYGGMKQDVIVRIQAEFDKINARRGLLP